MNDLTSLFARQAAWQQQRARLPWGDKLRMAVVMRRTLLQLRDSAPSQVLRRDSSDSQEDPP